MGIGKEFKKAKKRAKKATHDAVKDVKDTSNEVADTTVETSNQVAKGTEDASNQVADTTVDVAETVADGVEQYGPDVLKCIEAINKVKGEIQGLDPRTWMMACAKETLFKMGGPDDFKKCLLKKVKNEIKVIKDPEAFVEKLWGQIKDSCPTC